MAYNILVQGFCSLKIKITQFPDGFHLLTFFQGWVGEQFPMNSPQYYPYMTLRLSSHSSIFGLVFFVLQSLWELRDNPAK